MNRDMKVGLSLGVLLIGIVGALFFRREPEKRDDSPPALKNPQELDQRIADRQSGPHMLGPEDFIDNTPPSAGARSPSHSTTGASRSRGSGDQAYKVPDFLDRRDGQTQRELLTERPPTAPDPIQTERPAGSGERMPSPVPVPAHNRQWQANGNGSSGRQTQVAERRSPDADAASFRDEDRPNAAAAHVTHTIQPGDTLSGLASRYLGSSARYGEIYEANRKVLRSPNELPEGLTIVIPSKNAALADKSGDTRGNDRTETTPGFGSSRGRTAQGGNRVEARPVTKGGLTSDEEVPSTAEPANVPKAKFVPANRTPFNAGRSSGRAAPVDAEPVQPSGPTTSGRKPGPQLELDDIDDISPPRKATSSGLPPEEPLADRTSSTPRRYRVQKGDTLEQIAIRFYNRRSKALEILDANRSKLDSADGLREGMELILP